MVSEKTLRFLSILEKRPYMCLGSVKGVFTGFCGFVNGIEFAAYLSKTPELVSEELDFCIPADFRDFALEALGIELSDTLGWQHHIAETASSEDQAMSLFFSLWRRYLQAQGIAYPLLSED